MDIIMKENQVYWIIGLQKWIVKLKKNIIQHLMMDKTISTVLNDNVLDSKLFWDALEIITIIFPYLTTLM